MKCDICGGQIITRTEQRYHYKECGLDNVYLENIEVRTCESCGVKSPRLPRILELHSTIARAVALQPTPLRGIDLRFLRKQLGYTAKRWASLLRVDASTLSRWENDEQPIGAQSDALIRFLYFRIRDEQEGEMSQEWVADTIAAVTPDDMRTVWVNMDNPGGYSYRPYPSTGELAPA